MRDYFFNFRGRINRARYWLFVALAVPFFMLLVLCFWAYALSIPGAYENGGPTPWPSSPLSIVGAIVWGVALLVLLISFYATSVKRLHDRDKAWWWIVIFFFVPNILYGAGQYLLEANAVPNGSVPFLFHFAALALTIWALIELGVLRGTAGPNRFGPDPLAP